MNYLKEKAVCMPVYGYHGYEAFTFVWYEADFFFCIVVQEREEAYQRELEVARIEKEKEIARLRAQQERAKDKQAEKVNCGRL